MLVPAEMIDMELTKPSRRKYLTIALLPSMLVILAPCRVSTYMFFLIANVMPDLKVHTVYTFPACAT